MPALVSLLLGASACSQAGGSTAAEESTCEKLLGPAGLKWLESKSGGPEEAHMKSTDDLKKARSLFYEQLAKWNPEDTGIPSFLPADVCKVRKDVADSGKQLGIQYGPSLFPFDFPFDEVSEVSATPNVTPVNSNVKLVHGKDRDGTVRYRVYVKCEIPGAPATQENEVPIEGELTDTLTGETSIRVHLTHLLHTAQVMAKTLDCRNEPVIPAAPPASVT
ncbi:hypothetical protein ACFV9P_11590 [Streptomyces sp. NPDC059892]|uniref:hypothetical protein n=1 Tax=Streptomyces sp. NPDC059892 TaxID=3346989 RepID=UPI003669C803